MRRPAADQVLQALDEELVACLKLLDEHPGRLRDDRRQGQKEALRHIQAFLRNQQDPPAAAAPTSEEPRCRPRT